jgi:chromosome segregation ATPase
MTSVQENKNELEAAVRYCESAISRAKQTIESMEFRQQAASKAWHEQTGREESLTKKLAIMTDKYDRMKGYADKLLDENGELEEAHGRAEGEVELLQREIATLKNEVAELEQSEHDLKNELAELAKAYKDSTHEEITMKKAWREQREIVALRDDQIAMLERKLAKKND